MLVNILIAVVAFILVQLLRKTKIPVKFAFLEVIILTILGLLLCGYLKIGSGLNWLDAIMISAVVIVSDSILNMIKKP